MPGWNEIKDYVWVLGGAAAIVLLAWGVHYVLYFILRRMARKSDTGLDNSIARHTKGPVFLLLMTAALLITVKGVLPGLGLPEYILELGVRLLSLAMIVSVAWLVIRFTSILEDFLVERFKMDVEDNLAARKIHTQLKVIKRIVTAIVIIVAMATMLMTFDRVKQLGTSILASAGIIGIVAGLAAQRSLTTLFAGMQIAITQPIRIDDVVIVEGEWGRIEEIMLTYVVVRIWDLRRLIVPITYFIEKPFQNWTRVSSDILGTIFLYVDYMVPLEAVREEFTRLLNESKEWDKKVAVVQVTNTTERTMEVRLLVSARDAGTAWNLRCHIREKMVEFVQKNYPDALPRLRAEFERRGDGAGET